MKVPRTCAWCGTINAVRADRPQKDKYFCGPTCYQASIKKWRQWPPAKRRKTNFKSAVAVEHFENHLEFIESRNQWEKNIFSDDDFIPKIYVDE